MSDRLHDLEKLLVELWFDQAFAGKAPDVDDLPDYARGHIDLRRLAVYSNVLRENHLQVLQGIFPRTRKLAGQEWESLARAYCLALPQLTRNNRRPDQFRMNNTGAYFHNYFLANQKALAEKYPFMSDLIQFEIVQAELAESDQEVSHAVEIAAAPEEISLARRQPLVNPVLRLLHCRYDIPALIDILDDESRPQTAPALEPRQVVLVAARNPLNYRVRVVEVNDLTALLVQTAMHSKCSYLDLVAVASEHCAMAKDELTKHCLTLFADLHEHHVFVGSRELLGR